MSRDVLSVRRLVVPRRLTSLQTRAERVEMVGTARTSVTNPPKATAPAPM